MKTITKSQFKELVRNLPEFEPESGTFKKECEIEIEGIVVSLEFEAHLKFKVTAQTYDDPAELDVIGAYVSITNIIGYDEDNNEYVTTLEQEKELEGIIENTLSR